jgi:hypothetical protein
MEQPRVKVAVVLQLKIVAFHPQKDFGDTFVVR